MAIKIPVSNDFLSTFVGSINIFDCRLSGVSLPDNLFKQFSQNVRMIWIQTVWQTMIFPKDFFLKSCHHDSIYVAETEPQKCI